MIDGKIKKKLLKEFEKTGNVYLSCLKLGVDKSTHYRWKKESKKYKNDSEEAINMGRENNCDIAEHSLMINVRDKKMDAIKYVLSHNSERYKPKRNSSVVMIHKSIPKELPVENKRTLEDILGEDEENLNEYIDEIKNEFAGKELPPKPDGEPMDEIDIVNYQHYIREWLKANDKKTAQQIDNKNESEETHPISC